MAACLQFALSNPVKGRESEFETWYGGHHLFAGVRTDGLLAGQRFRRADGPWPSGEHEYLAVWELDDPPYALEQLSLVKGTDRMPVPDAIDSAGIQPPTMWIRASARNAERLVTDTGTRGVIVLMLCRAEPGQEGDFERALLRGGLADLVDRAGVISGDLLTLADEQIRNNARKIQFGLLLELSDQAIGLASLEAALPQLPHLDRGAWKAPVFRPVGRRVDKAEALRHFEGHGHGHGT